MISIFTKNDETIIVGLDDDGEILDQEGVLSNPESTIDLGTFDRFNFDPKNGHIISIHSIKSVRHVISKILVPG